MNIKEQIDYCNYRISKDENKEELYELYSTQEDNFILTLSAAKYTQKEAIEKFEALIATRGNADFYAFEFNCYDDNKNVYSRIIKTRLVNAEKIGYNKIN